jgi:endo-alpha-1,4-polygalactosaminidase (GH114 family)
MIPARHHLRHALLPAILIIAALLAAACGQEPSKVSPSFTPDQESKDAPLWVYWLHEPDKSKSSGNDPTISVIYYSYDGTDHGAFTKTYLEALQTSRAGNLVLVVNYASSPQM